MNINTSNDVDLYSSSNLSGVVSQHPYKQLITAVRLGDLCTITKLLKGSVKIDINDIVDENGNTLLHFAVDYDNLKIVKYLIEHGAEVNVKNNEGYTPLYHQRC